jgi:GH43 family beta-xylosidase
MERPSRYQIEQLETRMLLAGDGLSAEYFDGSSFTTTKLQRIDANVNFDYGNGSPDTSMGAGAFSVRWTGQVQPAFSQTYTFYTQADGGVRLWVNGQLVINRNYERLSIDGDANLSGTVDILDFNLLAANFGRSNRSWQQGDFDGSGTVDLFDFNKLAASFGKTGTAKLEDSGTIALTAGQKYDIKLEFAQSAANASAKLLWSSSSVAKQVIPQTSLYSAPLGLSGQYFDNSDLTNSKIFRTDSSVNFDWGTGSPDASIAADTFSARWTGQVQAQYNETYTFYVTSDDGARLWVNGQPLINDWTTHAAKEDSGMILLKAGQKYDIRLEYFDNNASASVNLKWSSASQAKQVIPSSALYFAPSGFAGQYYDNSDFTGAQLDRLDPSVNFSFGTGSPDPSMGADNFSVHWTGQLLPQYTQTYTFYTTSDDGVRLWIDGKPLIDNWTTHGPTVNTATIALTAGQRYDLYMDYYEGNNTATAKLEWSSASQARELIPANRLLASASVPQPTYDAAYTNPTLDKDRPDPGVLFDGGYYWMVHTSGGPTTGWPLLKSRDMINWTSVGNLLTSTNRQPWMNGQYWAPEIHLVRNATGYKYVLTGTSLYQNPNDATDPVNGFRVIVMATANSVDGPYTINATPIVAEASTNIDSHIFQDDDGRVYLYWKKTSGNTFIRVRELDPDNPTQFLAGSTATTILTATTTTTSSNYYAWEKGVAEGPWVIKRNGYYYLFYSGGFIDDTYREGVARSTSPTSGFVRDSANPILGNNATWVGPGHGSVVQDAAGNWWFVYHARHADNQSFGRVVMLDEISWVNDWPVFGNAGTPSTTAQTGPAIFASGAPAGTDLTPPAQAPLAMAIFANDENAVLN